MMMRYGCKILWLSVVLLFLSKSIYGAEICKELTATGNPDYPPYLWRDPENPQRLIGANVDLLQHLAKELGIVVNVVYAGPWSRAQEEVRAGRIDILVGYFMTQSRRQYMDFVNPPFFYTSSVVWVRSEEAFSYSHWDDLQAYKGGTLVNNSHGQKFDDFAQAHLSLEAVPTAEQAFQKILHKRNDYVIYEQYPGIALVRKMGVEQKLKILDPPVSSEGLYIALSRNSLCNQKDIQEKLSRKMQEVVVTSLPDTLIRNNLKIWDAQQDRVGE